jgi:transcription initiation factor IIE alpha subunit
MVQMKTWPAYFVVLEILNKKGDMTDDDLFDQLKNEYEDLGFKDFNDLLLKLEVSGKIRTSSMARGKRRIELVH